MITLIYKIHKLFSILIPFLFYTLFFMSIKNISKELVNNILIKKLNRVRLKYFY